MKRLSLTEAERLAIFFEESGAYTYRKRKEADNTPSSSAGGESSRVEFSLGGDDEDEDYEQWDTQNSEYE